MIAAWRTTPFGVVVALSGRHPVTIELQGAAAERWRTAVTTRGLTDALIDELLPPGWGKEP